MNNLFAGCLSLKYLPIISKWNKKNIKDIGYVFTGSTSLTSLPDISSWNNHNISDINSLFFIVDH